jgi:hypothetical protein
MQLSASDEQVGTSRIRGDLGRDARNLRVEAVVSRCDQGVRAQDSEGEKGSDDLLYHPTSHEFGTSIRNRGLCLDEAATSRAYATVNGIG